MALATSGAAGRDRQLRVIAEACSVVSAVWAAFWLIEIVNGEMPGKKESVLSVAAFAITAVGFTMMRRGRTGLVWSWLPLTILFGEFAMSSAATHGHEVAAVASFGTLIVFIGIGFALDRRRKRAPAAT